MNVAASPAKAIDHYEQRLHAQGFALVAGVDEAGRGALAGPLFAAAVILPDRFPTKNTPVGSGSVRPWTRYFPSFQNFQRCIHIVCS